MAVEFDPYLEWLQVPAGQHPPTRYQLLGLADFESDPERIRRAALDRMASVRRYQMGQRAALALQIQGELAAAFECLRTPADKERYDLELRRRLAPSEPPAARPFAFGGPSTESALQPAPALLPAAPPVAAPPVVSGSGPATVRIASVATMEDGWPKHRGVAGLATPRSGNRWRTASLIAAAVALAPLIGYGIFFGAGGLGGSGPAKCARPNASRARSKSPRSTSARSASTQRVARSQATDQTAETAIAPSRARPKTVDLLKLIDPQRDALAGDWRFDKGRLITPPVPLARLEIPIEPPEEYVLTTVFRCDSHGDSFNVGLVVGGRQVMVVIDGWGRTSSGLDMVDGRIANGNPTTKRGYYLFDGTPNTVVCTVQKNRVQVTCNSLTLIDWSGDSQQLSLAPAWKTRDPRRLFVGCFRSSFAVSRLELAPL